MDSRPRTGTRPGAVPPIRPLSSKQSNQSPSFQELLDSCKRAAVAKDEATGAFQSVKERSTAKPQTPGSMPGWLSERRTGKPATFSGGPRHFVSRPHTARDRMMPNDMQRRDFNAPSPKRPSRPKSSPPRQSPDRQEGYFGASNKQQGVSLDLQADTTFKNLNPNGIPHTRKKTDMDKVHSRYDADALDTCTLDSVGYRPKLNIEHNAVQNNNGLERLSSAASSSTLLRGFMTTVMEGRAGWDTAVEDLCLHLTTTCASLDADEVVSKIRDVVVQSLRFVRVRMFRVCMCMCVYMCTHTCTCIYIYIYIYIYDVAAQALIRVCVLKFLERERVYVYTYMHAWIFDLAVHSLMLLCV
jgi:hypothetical protein